MCRKTEVQLANTLAKLRGEPLLGPSSIKYSAQEKDAAKSVLVTIQQKAIQRHKSPRYFIRA
jgi:hypothetical protein